MFVAACSQDMRGDGVPPNLINFNLAVKALGRGGDWERATSILGEMKSVGVAPDERTFSAAIEVTVNTRAAIRVAPLVSAAPYLTPKLIFDNICRLKFDGQSHGLD